MTLRDKIQRLTESFPNQRNDALDMLEAHHAGQLPEVVAYDAAGRDEVQIVFDVQSFSQVPNYLADNQLELIDSSVESTDDYFLVRYRSTAPQP